MSDELLYLKATQEVDEDRAEPALWAKALTLCEGNIQNARYKYIKLRVEQLSAFNAQTKQTFVSQVAVAQVAPDPEEGSYALEKKMDAEDIRKGVFLKLIDGDYRLAKTFWLFGFVPDVFTYPIAGFANQNNADSHAVPWYITILSLLYLIYRIIVLIGTWRAAKKYNKNKILRIMALAYVQLNYLIFSAVVVLVVFRGFSNSEQNTAGLYDSVPVSKPEAINAASQQPKRVKSWKEVVALPAYQALSPERQERLRNDYFFEVLAPNLEYTELASARAKFDAETKPR